MDLKTSHLRKHPYMMIKRTIIRADRKRDNKVKFIIYQGLDEAIFEIIASTMTSKEV